MKPEPSAELRTFAAQLFEAARAEQPSAALERRLYLIDPEGAAPGPAREPRVTWALRAARWSWLAAAAVLASGAALWWRAPGMDPILISPDRGPAPARLALREPTLSPPAPARPEPAVHEATRPEPELREHAPRAPGQRPAPVAVRPARPPLRRASAVPRTSAPASPSDTALQTAPASEPAARHKLALRDEIELLEKARAALRSGNGAQALELLERHERERSGTALEAESTLLRIEALAALGRRSEASELAARFVRESPNSALGDRAKSFIIGRQHGAKE